MNSKVMILCTFLALAVMVSSASAGGYGGCIANWQEVTNALGEVTKWSVSITANLIYNN